MTLLILLPITLALFSASLLWGITLVLKTVEKTVGNLGESVARSMGESVAQSVKAMGDMAVVVKGGSGEVADLPENAAEQAIHPPWVSWGEGGDSYEGIDPTDGIFPDLPSYDPTDRTAMIRPGESPIPSGP